MTTDINESAILDFIDFGIVKPGDNFFHQGSIDADEELRKLAENKKDEAPLSEDELVDACFKMLETAVDEILRLGKVDAFAISGGADSRLLLTILRKNHADQLKDLYLYSRIHPLLGPEKDRDYLVASAVAKQANLNLHGEVSEVHPLFYLTPQNSNFTTPLAGLWGTELLGGMLLRSRLFSKFDLTLANQRKDSKLLSYITNSLPNFLQYEKFEYMLHYQLLKKTQASAFYRSLTWFYPKAGLTRAATPFVDSDFVNFMAAVDPKLILGYKLYAKVLEKYAKDFLKVPVNNFSLPPSFTEGLDSMGIEPKGIHVESDFEYEKSDGNEAIRKIVETRMTSRYSQYLLDVLPYLGYFSQFQSPDEQ